MTRLVRRACALLALCLAFAARADDELAQFTRHLRAGHAAYAISDFTTAAREYKEAWRLHPLPDLLFALGQTYRQLKDWEQSVFYLEQFVHDPGPGTGDRKTAEGLLEEVRPRAERARSHSWTRPAAIAAGVAAVLAGGLGAQQYLSAKSQVSDANARVAANGQFYRYQDTPLASGAQATATRAGLLFAGAAALAITGAVFTFAF